MRYINFSAISQNLKDEIIAQCITHDLIVEKVKDRISYLLDELEKSNPICDSCFMDYYRWLFVCYKLLYSIKFHSVDLISDKPIENDELDGFLKNVEERLTSILEKNK